MIFHLCERKDWEDAQSTGSYCASSLEEEGFIHLSTYGQVLSIANGLYQDAQDPVLLVLDNNKLDESLKWEGEEGLEFPHLYRAIELSEVVGVLSMKRKGREYVDQAELQNVAKAVQIETERLILREFHLSDFDAVQSYASKPELVQYMIWGPNDRLETRKFFSRVFQWQAQEPRDEFHFAVIEKGTSKLIGACNITIESFKNEVGSIGYIVDSEFQGKGYATEFSRGLFGFGFEKLRLHRIEATCDQMNEASFRVMQKLGMKKEGLLREEKMIKGRRRSTILCSLLKSEFKGKES